MRRVRCIVLVAGVCPILACGDDSMDGSTSGATSGGEASTADAATSGDDGSGDGSGDGGGVCPQDGFGGASPAMCDAPGAICEDVQGCCICGVYSGCGDDPVWACLGANPASCREDPPEAFTPCADDLVVCRYCLDAGPTVLVCEVGEWSDQSAFGCL